MITKLRESLRGRRVSCVEVCETCGVACGAGCRTAASREAVADRVFAPGLWL